MRSGACLQDALLSSAFFFVWNLACTQSTEGGESGFQPKISREEATASLIYCAPGLALGDEVLGEALGAKLEELGGNLLPQQKMAATTPPVAAEFRFSPFSSTTSGGNGVSTPPGEELPTPIALAYSPRLTYHYYLPGETLPRFCDIAAESWEVCWRGNDGENFFLRWRDPALPVEALQISSPQAGATAPRLAAQPGLVCTGAAGSEPPTGNDVTFHFDYYQAPHVE